MSDLPQPQVVITHESDLDGFVSGHLLQRLANHLFDQQTLLQAWNYTNFERRPLRENCAWVCDLNFSKRMDRDNWLIVDHHQTDVDPQRARLILDHSKSASLSCAKSTASVMRSSTGSCILRTLAICFSRTIRISRRLSITEASLNSICFGISPSSSRAILSH